MKPEDDRCEEHGMYLYRTGFGWSCKLGCYYTDDPQKIKDGFIAQYKEELKKEINKCFDNALSKACIGAYNEKDFSKIYIKTIKKEILELIDK